MSRRPISFLLILLSGILSCNKSEVVFPPMPIPASEISGSLVGWQLGDTMAISANATVVGPGTPCILASGAIRSNGRFFLTLPQPPPTTLLTIASPHDTLSDTTARVLMLTGLVISGPDQSTQYWAMNQYRMSPDETSAGDFQTSYFYADRPVRWRRTEIISGLGSVFDLQLEKGWNRVVTRVTVSRPDLRISTSRVENMATPTWYNVGRLGLKD
jgi:hypothetical protein